MSLAPSLSYLIRDATVQDADQLPQNGVEFDIEDPPRQTFQRHVVCLVVDDVENVVRVAIASTNHTGDVVDVWGMAETGGWGDCTEGTDNLWPCKHLEQM